MKMLELKSTKEFSVLMKYPDPSKHEFAFEKNSIYKTLSNGELKTTIKYFDGSLKEELEELCYSAFQLYLEHYPSFDSLIEKPKETIEDSEYFMQLWLYDEVGEQLYSDYLIDWTYAKACFPVLERKNLCRQCIVELYGDKNGELHEACYLEQYNKKDISALNGVCPTKRLPLPNGEVWYDANFGQFEL